VIENEVIDSEDDRIDQEKALTLPHLDTNLVTELMQTNGIMAEGNLSRLASVMRRARDGEAITVGVIGGSITQGSAATSPNKSYANFVHQWWVEAFPEAEISYVNAGIGATNSYLAVHRVDKDLLASEPDVVVVEFSVNDSNTTFFRNTYDDLVRKILKADNNPAVLLLFTTMEDGTSAQTQHLYVGFNYDLPRISYRQVVLKEMEEGRLAWKAISPDDIHPNNKGHAIIGEIMWNFFNSVYLKMDAIDNETESMIKEPLSSEAYANASIMDNVIIEPIQMGSFKKGNIFDRFNNNWFTDSGEESIVFEVTAKNIGIMYYKTTNGTGGQYEVYIDGEYSGKLDADFSGGWGNHAETAEVYSSKEAAAHTIEIKKSDTSTGAFFGLLGLLIS
jgi:lysophospholipase L1-like esterase